MKQKLFEGLKVLDLTNNLAGPTCSAMLADYGAEVIHVERPVYGDDGRFFPPMLDGYSTTHIDCNRGKKSLVLDLKDPESVKIVRRLAAEADIFVESYRPGVLNRLGLGYEDIKELNPRIIYCSISAFGQIGPYTERPGYDIIAQAFSGIMYMTGEKDGPPTKVGVELGDFVGALAAFGLVGTALYARERFGVGQQIDVSLSRILAWISARFDFNFTGYQNKRSGNQHSTLAPYGVFQGNNGESLVIAALSQNTWSAICTTMGKPEYAVDPRFATTDKRVENLPDVIEFIESWLKKFDQISQAQDILLEAGVPCTKVYTHKDIFNDPHVQEAGWIIKMPLPAGAEKHSWKYSSANPFTFSEFTADYRQAPDLGQHNHEILEPLGYTSQQIDDMENAWREKVMRR